MRRPALLLFMLILLLTGCNTYKYVPANRFLLKSVRFERDKNLTSDADFEMYLHQVPNQRFLGLLNLNLGFYNLSGRDTSKWINRTLRNLGEEPVLYDPDKTERSRATLQNLLVSRGYLNAEVRQDVRFKKRKAFVTYSLNAGTPYRINQFDFDGTNDSISFVIRRSLPSIDIKPGMLLNTEKLETERANLAKILQAKGYYAVQKEYFQFLVDSMQGNNTANVTLYLKKPGTETTASAQAVQMMRSKYRFRNVYFMLGVDMATFNNSRGRTGLSGVNSLSLKDYDTLSTGGYRTVYKGKAFISPEALIDNCRIVPGDYYDISKVNRTYARLNSLQYMKYVNIRFEEVPNDSLSEQQLDCYIVLSQNKLQGVGFDVEGTNTAGDLGVAGNVNYTHRNFFNGSELFQAKIRGAYEAVSSLSSNYTELGGELNLTLPEFKAPFLKNDFKQRVDATTEFRLGYQIMSQPQFKRTVASMGVRYNWSHPKLRQTLDVFDLSYVYMPWVDPTFAQKYLNDTSYLKYSYEDHFILRTAYTFAYSSVPFGSVSRNYYTWKGSFESAGNLLNTIYSLSGAKKDENGFYQIGKINFSQYLRGELEYAKSIGMNKKSRLAYRVGVGLAYPYGNSTILPFEKRFYSGGANSVRGWSVRTLGPGTYHNPNRMIRFMNQSGDIKLDMNLEYRGNLFSVVEGALFADAGNIWTVRDYQEQPGGQFKLNSFYKEIATSVGAGIRFAFDYFLLRIDLGMKVYDPSASQSDHWRIRHIDGFDDFAMHFAVGYPF